MIPLGRVVRLLLLLALVAGCAAPRPPRTATGTWRLLTSGSVATSGWYFSHAAIESHAPGRMWHAWGTTTALYGQSTAPVPINPAGFQPFWWENFGSDYDPTNKKFWFGPRAPGLTEATVVTFDPATNTYTDTGVGGWDVCGANAAFAWHADALYCWGGWSGVTQLHRKITAPDGPWQVHLTAMPPATSDFARYASWRGGVNRTEGYLWTIADQNELWICPLTAQACAAWQQMPTTGTKPAALSGVYTLDERRNKIIGWIGCGESSEGCLPVGQTYVLDLATRVWTLGPTAGPGVATPPSYLIQNYIPLYDRYRQRVLLFVTVNSELWWYDAGGMVPRPDRPAPASGVAVTLAADAPPPATQALTLTMTGTGTGTVTGAGAYPPAAPVTLTATPATGSTFAGWSPAPCAPSFPMPASALTCTATFTRTIPPTTCAITPGTLTPCPLPSAATNISPFPDNGNKESVWTYDATRQLPLFGFGDFVTTYASNSGNSTMWSYNATTNTWALVSSFCHPPGQISPAQPTDRGPFLYDARRDAIWMWNSVPNAVDGSPCTISGPPGAPVGSINRDGIVRMDMTTGLWTRVGPIDNIIAAVGVVYGVYDSAADAMLALRAANLCPGTGEGSRMHSTALATMTITNLAPWCDTNVPGYTSSAGGWTPVKQGERVRWAWDDAKRVGYVMGVVRRYDALGIAEQTAILSKYDRATDTWTRLADPPYHAGVAKDLIDGGLITIWDSVNQRVIHPVTKDVCAKVLQLLVYDPATNTWQDVNITGIHAWAGTVGYDPSRNVTIMAGSAFCEPDALPAPYLYLYRWAP